MLQLFAIALLLFLNGSQTDTRELLTQMALEQVMKQHDAERFRFQLSPRWIPNSLLQANVSSIQSVQMIGEFIQYTSFEVRYQIPSGTESVVIQFKVEGEQLIPVSKQRILSGETITPEKINLHWVNYIPGRDRYVQSANQLIGKTSRRTLNAGLPFRTHEVSEPVLVEAGNEVKLLFKLNGVELTLACDARQNGSLNEQIVVYCPETQKKYTAIINASGDALWQRTH